MVFDVEKIKAYYEELLVKKEEATKIALLEKDVKVAERFAQVQEEIAEQVEKEIIAEAEAPYLHDIELCEQFIVEEVAEEEVTEEIVEG